MFLKSPVFRFFSELFDCKEFGEISYYSAGRRPAKINDVRLVGKHYPESKHPLRKCCVLCRYKQKDRKYARKKQQTIVQNAKNLYAKIALNCIILKVKLGNNNIHV